MKKAVVSVCLMIGLAGVGLADPATNRLDAQGGFIYNHGMINPGDYGLTFTNAGIRDVTVSAGQLSGVDPETGDAIGNSANLLPLKVQSLETAGDVISGGSFVGNASGLTNFSASGLTGKIKAANMPSAGTWNASGVTINNAKLSGTVQVAGETLTVSSNLTVQGTISGDGSGLSQVAAAGPDGSFQFNQGGRLGGMPDFFIHPETGKPAFITREGNLMRFYKKTQVSDENLIYALRRFEDTTELCLFKDGMETLRLRGDGSIYATGALEVGGLSLGGGGTSGSTGWFIPEEGDLSMGSFTQQ